MMLMESKSSQLEVKCLLADSLSIDQGITNWVRTYITKDSWEPRPACTVSSSIVYIWKCYAWWWIMERERIFNSVEMQASGWHMMDNARRTIQAQMPESELAKPRFRPDPVSIWLAKYARELRNLGLGRNEYEYSASTIGIKLPARSFIR